MKALRIPLTLTRALRTTPGRPLQHLLAPKPTFLPYRRTLPIFNLRTYASATATPPQPLPHRPAPHRNPNEPVYELTFTCKACQERSAHTVSKQGYHKGTVLITCPGCKARHLISDHLHIFSDSKVTLEDIMKQKGENVQRGSIDAQGDIEFWSEKASEHGDAGDKQSGGQD